MKLTEEQALIGFYKRINDNIQNPEARDLEAEFLLKKLESHLDSGFFIQDESRNVIPYHLPDDEKDQIKENCSYSIIDGLPRFTNSSVESTVILKVVGSLVCNVLISLNSFKDYRHEITIEANYSIFNRVNLNYK